MSIKVTDHTLERDGKFIRHVWVENSELKSTTWMQIGSDGGFLGQSETRNASLAYWGTIRLNEAKSRNWSLTGVQTCDSAENNLDFFDFFTKRFDLSQIKVEYRGEAQRVLRVAGILLSEFDYSEWGAWA